ncbi:hypothetical protein GCM10027596_37410 [Nocardioides korecus]
MTVEVLLQHFVEGHDGHEGRERALAVLGPYLPEGLDRFGRGRIVTPDGGGEVFGLEERSSSGTAVFSDLRGETVWDVLVQVALATGWTILPLGHAPVLVPGQRIADLPEALRAEATRLDDDQPARALRARLSRSPQA